MEEERKITIPAEEYKEMAEIRLRYKALKDYLENLENLENNMRIFRETVCAIMGISAEDETN